MIYEPGPKPTSLCQITLTGLKAYTTPQSRSALLALRFEQSSAPKFWVYLTFQLLRIQSDPRRDVHAWTPTDRRG